MNINELINDKTNIDSLAEIFSNDKTRWELAYQHIDIINNLQKSNPQINPVVFTFLNDKIIKDFTQHDPSPFTNSNQNTISLVNKEIGKIKFNNFYEKLLVTFVHPEAALALLTDNVEEDIELLSVALINDHKLPFRITHPYNLINQFTGQYIFKIGEFELNSKKFGLAYNNLAKAAIKTFERSQSVRILIDFPSELYTDEFCQKALFPGIMIDYSRNLSLPLDRAKEFFEFCDNHLDPERAFVNVADIAYSTVKSLGRHIGHKENADTEMFCYLINKFPNTLELLKDENRDIAYCSNYTKIIDDLIKDPTFFFYVKDNVKDPAKYFKTIFSNYVHEKKNLATVPQEFAMLMATNYPEVTLLMNVDKQVATAAVMCNNMIPVLAKACKREYDFPTFMEASNDVKNNNIVPDCTYFFNNCNNYYSLNDEEKIQYSVDTLLLNTALSKLKLRRPESKILDISNKLDIIMSKSNTLGNSIISKYDHHDDIEIPYFREADYNNVELV